MLSILADNRRYTRREMLSIGSLGFGGFTLANLLAAEQAGGALKKQVASGKSVIFLLQHGGPSQFETFDPKLDVSDGIRTVGGVTSTSIPGIRFGATMSDIARHAHRLAIVRSFATGSSGHSNRPLISSSSLGANIGSLYSRIAGSTNPHTGMPTNITLFPNSIEPAALGPDERFGKFSATGPLSKSCEPFTPGGGSTLQENMKLTLPRGRFDDRRGLLKSLDKLRNELDNSGTLEGLDKFRQQALSMVLQGAASAFDLDDEDARTLARYDTAPFIDEKRYADKKNGQSERRWYQNNAHTLGRLLLLARRLCESGCRFVTVATRFVWDMHADANNLGVSRGMEAVGRPFNQAISAFIEDCEDRGLSDEILLVSTGEMGRTPKINARGGRDHWGRLTPLLLYGGGITAGQVIGKSERDGSEPARDPVNSDHLVSTIMHTLFDMGELRVQQGLPADLARMIATAAPIPGLH